MGTQHEVGVLFDELSKAWETNDATEVAGLFTEDGSLINPFGERADGRAAVTAMYADYFSGLLAGTATTFEVQSVRPIGEADVLVDGRQPITTLDGAVVLDVHVTALLRKVDVEWRFVDVRPYAFQPLPA